MSNPVKAFAGRKLAETFLYPPEQPFPKTPAEFGMNHRDVEFRAATVQRCRAGWSMRGRTRRSS